MEEGKLNSIISTGQGNWGGSVVWLGVGRCEDVICGCGKN